MRRPALLLSSGLVSIAMCAACSETPAPTPVVAPSTTTMILSHAEAGTLSVLDTALRDVVGTITLGARIGQIVLSADAERAFVSVPDAIAIVNVSARRVIRTLSMPGEHSGLIQAGEVLYVIQNTQNRGTISALDLNTGAVTGTRTIDDLAGEPAIAADGRQIFVPHSFYTGKVTALDAPGLRVRKVMNFEDGVSRLDFGPDGRHLYVPNGSTGSGRVTVVDPSTHRNVHDIDLPEEPTDVAIHPDGIRAYVPLFRAHSIGVIDLVNRTLVRTVPVRDYPSFLALSADGTALFVLHNGWDAISAIDTLTLAVEAIPIGSSRTSLQARRGSSSDRRSRAGTGRSGWRRAPKRFECEARRVRSVHARCCGISAYRPRHPQFVGVRTCEAFKRHRRDPHGLWGGRPPRWPVKSMPSDRNQARLAIVGRGPVRFEYHQSCHQPPAALPGYRPPPGRGQSRVPRHSAARTRIDTASHPRAPSCPRRSSTRDMSHH